jgi:DNA-binding cell septation regulator SpoVG
MKPVRVWVTGKPNGQGYLASVTMDLEMAGGFLIQLRGMRLIETKEKKIVLAMPNIKDGRGNWQTIVSPLNQATRDVLENAALDEWKKLWPDPQSLNDLLEPL